MFLYEHARPLVLHVKVRDPEQTQFRRRDAAPEKERDDRRIAQLFRGCTSRRPTHRLQALVVLFR